MSAEALRIRPYQPADEEAVVSLWLRCGLVVPHNNPLRDIRRKLKINPEWFLVGTRTGEIVATCMFGYDGHRGSINYLAVAPEQQRRGIAAKMMQASENILCSVGCPKINLQVRDANKAVIEFYESIGYVAENIVNMGKRLDHDEPYRVD